LKHFSYSKFYQILKSAKRILINIVLFEKGKIINSLNSYNNFFFKIENGFELIIQFETLFIFKVLSNSKIYWSYSNWNSKFIFKWNQPGLKTPPPFSPGW
jgi:hypothetical protein